MVLQSETFITKWDRQQLSKIYYKVRKWFTTKCDKLLLQNMSGITKWCVAMITHTQSYVFQFQNFKPPWKMGTYIKWTFPETELATNKSKGQTMCHLYSIQICSKQNAQSIWTSFQTGWKYKNKYEKQLP